MTRTDEPMTGTDEPTTTRTDEPTTTRIEGEVPFRVERPNASTVTEPRRGEPSLRGDHG
jgi:hypothetical protein